MPHSAFGSRLQTMVSLCSGAYRLSKRSIEVLFRDFFGADLSLGSVSNLEHATSEALAAPFEEAAARAREARTLHVDETGWRQRAKRAWLWCAVTLSAVVFLVRARRNRVVAKELIGPGFAGVTVTDQYNGYHWLRGERRQLCWAHLIRHFRGLADRGALAKAFGERLLELTKRWFDEVWHRYRRRAINRAQFRAAMAPFQAAIGRALHEGTTSGDRHVRSLCEGLVSHEVSLWAFVNRIGVEPTNNAAERALRCAVLWRKVSFGTESERGSRFVERILTVVGTLRLQKRDVLEYLTACCRAATAGQPAPSLFAA